MIQLKRTIFLLLLFICITAPAAFAQKELREYLDQADFFRLRESLTKYESSLDNDIRLFFAAFVDNAFNQNERSIRRVDSFMLLRKADWYDTEIAEILQMQRDNYCKTYRYREAAQFGDAILKKYAAILDEEIATDIQNSNKIWRALENTQPQLIGQHGNVAMPIEKDMANLWTLPVTTGDFQDQFIFDTGANISTISNSAANKMKLKRLPVRFNVHGFQGASISTGLGVADSITLGTLQLYNVVFMIMPDDALNFPQINYKIHGIIGYPVIRALKEVHIYKKGVLEIPSAPAALPKDGNSNLAIHGLYPMIRLGTDKGTYNFHFDTGAKISDLFDTYFHENKRYITKHGKKKVTEFGSAGGTRKMEAYELKNFKFYIGDKTATLPVITILTKPIKSTSEMVYGNIGQDLMEQFDEMIINFESMYVLFS